MAGKPKGAETQDERTRIAHGLLCKFWPDWKIRDSLQLRYGVSRRTADRIMSRARALLSEAGGTTKQEKRDQVTAIIEDLIGDPGTDVRAKARLVKEYVELHGLRDQTPYEAPKEDVKIVVGDWRAKFRKRLESGDVSSAKKNGAGGNGAGGNGAGSGGA